MLIDVNHRSCTVYDRAKENLCCLVLVVLV